MTGTQDENKIWYAVYTKPRWEKKVFNSLQKEGMDAYLPLYKTLRQWSDRKKLVEVPLFTSYVFVHISLREYYLVLQTHGVVRYVTFEGRAVSIPEKQINHLKLLIDSNAEIELTETAFKKGQTVEVVLGSLKGLIGELVSRAREKHFLLRIHHINQNLLVKIPPTYLRIIQ